jgi:phage terminase large subunit-like protein
VTNLSPALRRYLNDGWIVRGGDRQFAPDNAWPIWLVLGGRGAGKTRAGAEWVNGMAGGLLGIARTRTMRIALVGETFADVRDVMIEGPSGLVTVAPRGERPQWKPSLRRLEWANGAVAHAFSAEDPDSLRGPQFEAAWSDELGKWRYAQDAWDMLQFGLRLGERPRQVVTTTPRPTPLLRRLLGDPSVRATRMRTADNAHNLAPGFLERVTAAYGGTRLGRQELDGELIEDRADALWRRSGIEAARVAAAPALARVVVAVDPPASSGRGADACGIVAAGLDATGTAYVVADESVRGLGPEAWAARAVRLYRALQADALVAEVNQGGDMVSAVMRVVDPGVPVTAVHATRGKYARAEPVSALYAQGRVRHAGAFPELEDEMCDFGPTGLTSGRSPDRLDALVWALTYLMLAAEPRIRAL